MSKRRSIEATASTDWRAPDRGIETRMALAIGLVIAGYIIIVGLAFATAWWFGLIALCIAAGLILSSAKSASALIGAREVTAAEEPRLVGIVTALSQLEGRKPPRVMVAEDPTPNAFAVGWFGGGVVCVTRGLLQSLETHELEGVIAHELAHLANRDALLMTAAWFLPLAAALVAAFGAAFLAVRARGWIGLFFWMMGMAFVVLGAFCLVVSLLIVMGLSRVREFAADRYAAELTGRPRALASALGAISQAPTSANPRLYALSGLLFFNPTSGFLHTLFATHPSPEKRIARLTALAERMEGPAAQPDGAGDAQAAATHARPPGVIGEIQAELASMPTRSMTVSAMDLARRFGSKATRRLPRKTLDRATSELREAGIGASEINGPAGALVRLTLLRPLPTAAAPVAGPLPATSRRPPRTLSGVIFGSGILGGAALGSLLLVAMLASSSTASSNGGDECGAGNGVTDPPVLIDSRLEASPRELVLRLAWCDDTDTYDGDAELVLTGPARHSFSRTLPPRITPGRSVLRFSRQAGGEAEGVRAGLFRYRVTLTDIDDHHTSSDPRQVRIPATEQPQARGIAARPRKPVRQASACEPSYTGACIPPYPPDLDCGEVPVRNFASVGIDPHNFDADDDGIACEE